MSQATDTDIQELKTAISDLTSSFGRLREEMRVGFSNVETKFAEVKGQITNLETKFDEKFNTVNSRLDNIDINAKITADLSEKVGELKNWKQIAIVVFTASLSGSIAWFLKSGIK